MRPLLNPTNLPENACTGPPRIHVHHMLANAKPRLKSIMAKVRNLTVLQDPNPHLTANL